MAEGISQEKLVLKTCRRKGKGILAETQWEGAAQTAAGTWGEREALANGKGTLPLNEALCVGWQLPTQGVPVVLGQKREGAQDRAPLFASGPMDHGPLGSKQQWL